MSSYPLDPDAGAVNVVGSTRPLRAPLCCIDAGSCFVLREQG